MEGLDAAPRGWPLARPMRCKTYSVCGVVDRGEPTSDCMWHGDWKDRYARVVGRISKGCEQMGLAKPMMRGSWARAMMEHPDLHNSLNLNTEDMMLQVIKHVQFACSA